MNQRLYDYINIKKYNRLHKITPGISPEKVFNITQDDLHIIQNYYNKKPNIQYKQVFHYMDDKLLKKIHNPNINPIMNKIDNFEEKPSYMIGEIINDNKKNFQINKNRSKHVLTSLERDMITRGTNIYSEFAAGIPNRPQKSFGYDNPQGLYFDYIDKDIQLPEHVDLDFPRGGENTRLENKINRKYYREIMF
jgi:hypothetical protein